MTIKKSASSDLYTAAKTRWTPKLKLQILRDLEHSKITLSDLAIQHSISPEEIDEWQKLYAKDGKRALRTTKLKQYRPK